MRDKKRSFGRISYLFYCFMVLSIAACGSDSKSTTTTNTLPEDLLNTPSPVENPKTNVGIDPSLVMGQQDNLLRVSYYDLTNGDLKFARCTDAGCTAPIITTIDSDGDVGLNSSLKIGGDGFPRITYYDATNGDLEFARCTDADCTAPVLTTVDAGLDTATDKKNVGSGSSLAIASDGFARISYYDAKNGKLKLAQCTDADCSSPTLTSLGPLSGPGGAHTSIDLLPDNSARISYWNFAVPALGYSLCDDPDCNTNTDITIDAVGSLPLTGSNSSIIIGPDGFSRISYFGEETIDGVTTGVVKYVQCTDDACTTPNITKIASALFSASPSIAITALDGFARITYYDAKNAVLKFVRCGNLRCENPTITTVDATPDDLSSASDSGEFSSLVIGTKGLAKIAFFDRTKGDLKLAQCSDLDCTTVSIITIDR